LPGGHAQTIWPYLLPRPTVAFRRERVDAPDGDFWDFDWVDAPVTTAVMTPATATAAPGGTPLVILFHGLEGGSESHYARALMKAVAIGWRGVIPHFRGCSGELNRAPRAYHSGDHEEVGAILAAIRARVPEGTPTFAVGVSLGGSALLNWLGRAASDANRLLLTAAAVSTPLDLTAAGNALGQGLNRIYTRNFLGTLIPKSVELARRYPALLDPERVRRARTMFEFDDAVTAPLHGFDGAADYWRRASSKPWLAAIALLTLVLNARNDLLRSGGIVAFTGDASRHVLLEQPDDGGRSAFCRDPSQATSNGYRAGR
jgi:predicted alpha/beta-fold hydrolase